MLDWEGNMVEKRDRVQILLSEVEIDSTMVSSAEISKLETEIIDERMSDLEPLHGPRKEERPPWTQIPPEVDDVASVLCGVLLVLDLNEMCSGLCTRADVGQFQMSIGSTDVTKSKDLQAETVADTESETDSEETSMDLWDDFFDTISDPLLVEIDLDEFMASAAHAKPPSHTAAEHLSKVWRIDLKMARKTLGITSQNCARIDNLALSRNYSTNDRMLRYKRLNEYFFMEVLGRVLGPAKGKGNEMAQWLLKANGNVVPRRTLRPLHTAARFTALRRQRKEKHSMHLLRSDGEPQ
jgi:hypothetical protein